VDFHQSVHKSIAIICIGHASSLSERTEHWGTGSKTVKSNTTGINTVRQVAACGNVYRQGLGAGRTCTLLGTVIADSLKQGCDHFRIRKLGNTMPKVKYMSHALLRDAEALQDL